MHTFVSKNCYNKCELCYLNNKNNLFSPILLSDCNHLNRVFIKKYIFTIVNTNTIYII